MMEMEIVFNVLIDSTYKIILAMKLIFSVKIMTCSTETVQNAIQHLFFNKENAYDNDRFAIYNK